MAKKLIAGLLAAAAFLPAAAQAQQEELRGIEQSATRDGEPDRLRGQAGDDGASSQPQPVARTIAAGAFQRPQREADAPRARGGWEGRGDRGRRFDRPQPQADAGQPQVEQRRFDRRSDLDRSEWRRDGQPRRAPLAAPQSGGDQRPGWADRPRGNGPRWVDRGRDVTDSRAVQRRDDRRWDGQRRDDANRWSIGGGDDGRWVDRGRDDANRWSVGRRDDRRWTNERRDDWRWSGDRAFDAPANRGWNDRNAWNRRWRDDDRYDWGGWRQQNRNAFRLPRYDAPTDWTSGYRRFGVGALLSDLLWQQNYWIDDPWAFRLPEAYDPYRWVRYYNDALLVDLDSGQVVDAVYDIFW